MDTPDSTRKQFCGGCGQAILLVAPLPAHIRCPRCGLKMKVSDFVARETPVMAIPASAPPSSLTAGQRKAAPLVPPSSHIEPPEVELDDLLESSRLGSGAVGRAVGAFQGLNKVGQVTLQMCGAVDELLAGKRRWVIVSVVVLAGGASALEETMGERGPLINTLTGILLLLTIWFFTFSFAGSLREDGVWRGALIFDRLFAGGRALVDEIVSFREAPTHIRWRTMSVVFAGVGLSLFAAANLLALFTRAFGLSQQAVLGELAWYGGASLLIALLFAAAFWRSRPLFRRTIELDSRAARELTGGLPPIVALEFGEGAPAGDSFVHEIIDVLARWKPRLWPSEKDYQFALHRHLERHLPDVMIERERRLGQSRGEGIADFVVGDCVILELKRGFRSKGSVDRAIGQMYAYATQCPDMPSLLVIFEANLEDVAESLATSRLEDLHQRQATVTVRMPVPAKYEGLL